MTKRKTTKKYTFREGHRQPVAAQVVGETLAAIGQQEGGVTAENVVEHSRPEKAPLHPCFEWNDPTAANLYREHQARGVIRSVDVVIESKGSESVPVIGWVNVRTDDGKVYLPSDEIAASPDLVAQVIRDARRGLAGWVRRHRHLSELAPVVAAIEPFLTEEEVLEEAGAT